MSATLRCVCSDQITLWKSITVEKYQWGKIIKLVRWIKPTACVYLNDGPKMYVCVSLQHSKWLMLKGCMTCHLYDGCIFFFSLHGGLGSGTLGQLSTEALKWTAASYKSKTCHSTTDSPALIYEQRWASFSSRLIYISKWHIYYSAEYEVTFCFTPVLTFNSKDNGQEGKAILRPILMCFNIIKLSPDFIVIMEK